MKVVVLDDWEKSFERNPSLERLKEHFEVVVYQDQPSPQELLERLKAADVVVPIRERTRFTKNMLQQMSHIKLIAQTGAGLAHIDMEEAKRLHIPVVTTPGGSNAVVELIFGFILAYARQLIPLHQDLKQGIWTQALGYSLENKTIGIIGLGKIGSGVARVAQAFNMKVLAWGPRLTEERATEQGVEYTSLERLLREAHYVTLNVRLVPETRHLIQASHLAMMRKDGLLINTSRGEIVEEEALLHALQEKQIGGAALDVFTQEPLPPEHPLLKLDNVILSPHIGWKTDEMFHRFCTHAVENILGFFQKT